MAHGRQKVTLDLIDIISQALSSQATEPTFAAFSASSRLFLATSRASRCTEIIFKFSLVPAWTERKSNAFEILMLACWQRSVKIVTMLIEKLYLEATYTAPNVCPRLLNIGIQMTEECSDCDASEENR